MIDFVVISADLHPTVLDIWVKKGAEMSTDYHLVMSWIRWHLWPPPGAPGRSDQGVYSLGFPTEITTP